MEISDQEKLLYAITDILSDLDIEYFITGGMAVSVWGRPRSTFDIDIIVKLVEPKAALLAKAFKKISEKGYADEEMTKDAIRNKWEFNFIDANTGIKVDFWVTKGDARSLREFKNKRLEEISSRNIYFISPEDLILNKLKWHKIGGGEKHVEDTKSIFSISGKGLDMVYLKKWALQLGLWEDLVKIIGER